MTNYFLNDMQYAFLLGRNSDAPLCGCSCHIFAEYHAPDADLYQIQSAWKQLGNRHPVLHSVISESGEVTFADPENFMQYLKLYDLSDFSAEEAEQQYQQSAELYRTRNMNIHSGEILILHVFLMPEGVRFCFEGDCIAFDITSYQIFIHDFSRLYAGDTLPELPSDFHPYEFTPVSPERKKADRHYWQAKASDYGAFPAESYPLPSHSHFTAHTRILSAEIYQKLHLFAQMHDTEIEILLLTLFSKAFSEITSFSHFVLNIPVLDRKQLPARYARTGGEYTALLMTDININPALTIETQLSEIAEIYQNDCAHTGISGMKIQKILKKQNHYYDYHVTFSSHIGIDMNDSVIQNSIGILQSLVTQTPRVIMDSEFFLSDGNLLISLVTPDNVFPEGMENRLLHEFAMLAEKITKEKKS